MTPDRPLLGSPGIAPWTQGRGRGAMSAIVVYEIYVVQ